MTYVGEYLINAQGEDVVAGIRTPLPIKSMQEKLPQAYDELMANIQILEKQYGDMQDIEFTIQEGKKRPPVISYDHKQSSL
jgi:pyruvate,orthophosphate dikinase